jgi:Integrase core domain
MIRRRGPLSQTWRTFLRNHADAIAAIDLCVVPTLTFEYLFAFLVLGHGRRQLLWFAVTRHPTAEWLAQQIVEAFPWGTAPTYLVRDNDGAYGRAFTDRVRTMGIRDHPISPRSPWQNPYVERLIGTLRRECLDQVLIYGERHLRRIRLCIRSITMRRARTWGWARTRRYDDPSNDLGPSSSHQSYPAYIINTRGYDFREPQAQTAARVAKAGAPSCATICRRLQPWTCSWSRPSALACCTLWSLSGWLGPDRRMDARQITEAAPIVGQRCAILAPCSGSEASRHSHSSADCITTTYESEFSVHTADQC